MKPSIILQELSERLGISVSQISRALNHKGRVAAATRERILQAAREAGYRNLSPRHFGRVVLIPGGIHDIYRGLIDGFQREVGARSGRLVLMDAAASDLLNEFMVDVVIAVDVPSAVLAELRQRHPGVPIVTVSVYGCGQEAVVTLERHTVLRRIASWLPGRKRHTLLAVFPTFDASTAIRCGAEGITELMLPVGRWLTLPDRPELQEHEAVLIASHWQKAALLALCRRRYPDLPLMFYHNSDFVPGVDTASACDGWYVDWRTLAAVALDAASAGPAVPLACRRLEPLLRQSEGALCRP